MPSGSSSGETPSDPRKAKGEVAKPDWADGLRQLYDSVVDEPLPDAFKDLLNKLDAAGGADDSSVSGGSD